MSYIYNNVICNYFVTTALTEGWLEFNIKACFNHNLRFPMKISSQISSFIMCNIFYSASVAFEKVRLVSRVSNYHWNWAANGSTYMMNTNIISNVGMGWRQLFSPAPRVVAIKSENQSSAIGLQSELPLKRRDEWHREINSQEVVAHFILPGGGDTGCEQAKGT